MTNFSVIPFPRLREIFSILTPIQWPARAADVLPDLMTRLGWAWTGDPDKDINATTDLSVNYQSVFIDITDEGYLYEIRFRVTDTLSEGEDTASVDTAYDNIVDEFVHKLGRGTSTKKKQWWDLPTGGRWEISRTDRYVRIELLSKEAADLERDEALLGIGPDRVLGEDDPTYQSPWGLVVGLSADGTKLQIIESKGETWDGITTGGAIIGFDENNQPIWADRGSTDYLDHLLHWNTDLITLFHHRPDIANGLRDGSITIEYAMSYAPGDGTSTYTPFIIDPTRLHLNNLIPGSGSLTPPDQTSTNHD